MTPSIRKPWTLNDVRLLTDFELFMLYVPWYGHWMELHTWVVINQEHLPRFYINANPYARVRIFYWILPQFSQVCHTRVADQFLPKCAGFQISLLKLSERRQDPIWEEEPRAENAIWSNCIGRTTELPPRRPEVQKITGICWRQSVWPVAAGRVVRPTNSWGLCGQSVSDGIGKLGPNITFQARVGPPGRIQFRGGWTLDRWSRPLQPNSWSLFMTMQEVLGSSGCFFLFWYPLSSWMQKHVTCLRISRRKFQLFPHHPALIDWQKFWRS